MPFASVQSGKQGRSILELIGNTPMVRFQRIGKEFPEVELLAKAEWFNPGGSVKDRAALGMILDGERRGLLTKEKILIDATSGNTGIAYAMIAAERGYRVTLAMPKNASAERKQTPPRIRRRADSDRPHGEHRWGPALCTEIGGG